MSIINPILPSLASPSVPRRLVYDSVPVEVWQEQPAGLYAEVGDNMVCDLVQRRSDDVDRAYFHYRFAENQPPLTKPGGSAFRRDFLATAQRQIDPNRRLRVMVSATDSDRVTCLMQGYPAVDTLSWSRNPRQHDEGLSFEVAGVLDAWRRDFWAQVVGRFVHGAYPIEDSETGGIDRTIDGLKEITSAPCVFNENGRPNCSPYPIQLQLNLGGDESVDVPLYVFASPGEKVQHASPADSKPVEYWSYGRALLYLIYVYGFYQYNEMGLSPPVALPTTWIQKLIDEQILPFEPVSAPYGTAFAKAFWTRPNGLETDSTSLYEALSMVCADCGAHFHVEHEVSGFRSVTPRLKMWADGLDADMYERGNWFVATRAIPRRSPPTSGAIVMRQNRAMQARITRDWETVQNTPIVVGGRRLYEAGFNLAPGWLPLDNLDNVVGTAATEAAKTHWRPLGVGATEPAAAVETYFRSHKDHDAVRDVGRLWVLNEAYTYFPGSGEPYEYLYARELGPSATAFGTEAYEPFAPADYDLRDWMLDTFGDPFWNRVAADQWALRPRPFGNLWRAEPVLHEEGPVCDVSFDSGATWQTEDRFELLTTEAAIRFIAESPLDITPLDPTTRKPDPWWDDNMWWALIEGRFRVRVTATIEGDSLVIPRWDTTWTASGGPVSRLRTVMVDRPDYQVVTRHGSKFLPVPLARDIVHSDLEAAEAYRRALGDTFADKQGAVQMSEPYIDVTPQIGQRVGGIRGIGVSLTRLLGGVTRNPQIVGVDHQLSGAQSTTPLIGDLRHVREEPLA